MQGHKIQYENYPVTRKARPGELPIDFLPIQWVSWILIKSLVTQNILTHLLTNGYRQNFKSIFQVGMVYQIY